MKPAQIAVPVPQPDMSALSTSIEGRDAIVSQFRAFGGQVQAWCGGYRLPIARRALVGRGFFSRQLVVETVFLDGHGRITAWKADHADIGRDMMNFGMGWRNEGQGVSHYDLVGKTLAVDPVNKALVQITEAGEAVPFGERSLIGVGQIVPLKEKAQRPEYRYKGTQIVWSRADGVLMELNHPVF